MPMQVVERRSRGFICVNAHPAGCRRNVELQIEAARAAFETPGQGIRNALIIGGSGGYGLASRIVAAWGFGARTLSLALERPPEGKRTATAGYYNTVAFDDLARRAGLEAHSLNLDAFSDEAKRQALTRIRASLAPLDLVIYSLAAPRRVSPRTGQAYVSALKPIGKPYTSKTVDLDHERVCDVTIEPATEREIGDTVAVMGGEDWRWWIETLLAENLLAEGARTLAYSYLGPRLTWPVYREGTIGRAKLHLEATAAALDEILRRRLRGAAWVSVNQAVVTQAAAAIPVVPLYLSLLLRIAAGKRILEGPVEQMARLFAGYLDRGRSPAFDVKGRIRLDDLELRDDVQGEIEALWPQITTENLHTATDFAGFQRRFRNLFGFEVDTVDYAQPVETDLALAAD